MIFCVMVVGGVWSEVHAGGGGSLGDESFLMGDDDFAEHQIDVLSEANKLLFVDDNLRGITEPLTLIYDFSHRSAYDKAYGGRVLVKVNRVRENGRKDLVFRYLRGKHRIRFHPRPNMKTNPLFMLFLESDAREMQRITGGSSLFFRSRLRQSLAAAGTEAITFDYEGKQVDGYRIVIRPYDEMMRDPQDKKSKKLIERFEKFRYKTYEFILSSHVLGGIYRLRSFVPDESGEAVQIDDLLLYRGFERHRVEGAGL
ncbi:MAG: hypothetical protein GDA50_01960 [Alphaproteobacteria bacterium GM202ARS2]|nr:hypothetical protein [Alphaproteobacteria bacterium GM202ARS2]